MREPTLSPKTECSHAIRSSQAARRSHRLGPGLALALLLCGCHPSTDHATPAAPAETTYAVTGVVQRIDADGHKAIIKHQMIPGYMMAMTMPFPIKDPREVEGLQPGDEITFRLLVTPDESWIDQVTKVEPAAPPAPGSPPPAAGQ